MEVLILILPFLGMFLIMYLLFILPEKKRNKIYKEMISNLQKNDEIITKGGIIGKIIIINDDSLVIESSQEKTRLKITKTAVATKLNKKEN